MIAKGFVRRDAKVFAIMKIAASAELAGPPDGLVDRSAASVPPRSAVTSVAPLMIVPPCRYEAARPGNAWVLPRQNAARFAEPCMASAPNVRSRWSLTATRAR
jgi:hypothetical protein